MRLQAQPHLKARRGYERGIAERFQIQNSHQSPVTGRCDDRLFGDAVTVSCSTNRLQWTLATLLCEIG